MVSAAAEAPSAARSPGITTTGPLAPTAEEYDGATVTTVTGATARAAPLLARAVRDAFNTPAPPSAGMTTASDDTFGLNEPLPLPLLPLLAAIWYQGNPQPSGPKVGMSPAAAGADFDACNQKVRKHDHWTRTRMASAKPNRAPANNDAARARK